MEGHVGHDVCFKVLEHPRDADIRGLSVAAWAQRASREEPEHLRHRATPLHTVNAVNTGSYVAPQFERGEQRVFKVSECAHWWVGGS